MSSIKLQGSTSGEITISAPAVAGTNTLTLPAETGNILTDGSALPAIDGSALTGISGDVIASSLGASDNTNGYIRFSNNLLINWVRKTSTLQQTITFPLAFTEVYGAYTGADTTTTAYINVRSLSTTQISLGSQGALITGWALVFGRKT